MKRSPPKTENEPYRKVARRDTIGPVFDILAKLATEVNDDCILIYTKDKEKDINKEKCKIMKFTSTWNYKDVLDIIKELKQEDYPNLFIFVIDTRSKRSWQSSESTRDSKRPKLSRSWEKALLKFGNDRPMVLQLKAENENVTEFYYKEVNSSNFDRVDLKQRDFEEHLNLSSFLWTFLDDQIEDSKKVLLDKLYKVKNLTLIVRFLRILSTSNVYIKKLILKCAAYGSVNSLFASIDYLFDGNKRASAVELMRENLEKVSIIESFNSTKQTSIILEAVRNKNKKVVEYLLSNWTHLVELPFEHQLEISTTAFDKNQIDVLYDLINVSDYPFPTNFNIKSIKDGRLRRLANKRDEFHKAISKDDIKAFDIFNKENPNLKCAFNTNNKTALCQAIDSNKEDAYIKLKALRFCKAEHEEDRKHNFDNKKLVFATRSNIKNSNKNEEKCILVLLAKSSIHNVKDDKKVYYHAKIRKWFEDISKVKYGQLLLKVVSSCEKLKIVFDFEEKYVSINIIILPSPLLAYLQMFHFHINYIKHFIFLF